MSSTDGCWTDIETGIAFQTIGAATWKLWSVAQPYLHVEPECRRPWNTLDQSRGHSQQLVLPWTVLYSLRHRQRTSRRTGVMWSYWSNLPAPTTRRAVALVQHQNRRRCPGPNARIQKFIHYMAIAAFAIAGCHPWTCCSINSSPSVIVTVTLMSRTLSN